MKCNTGNNAFIFPDFAALHPGYIEKMGLTVYQCRFFYPEFRLLRADFIGGR